jgi:hypothetical protein
MATDRPRRIVIVFLSVCLGVSILILGCMGTINMFKKIEGSSSQGSVRSLRITIDKSQRKELFDQFRKFADKNAFEFYMSDYGTGGEDYLIEMSRNDIIINAIIIHHDPKIVSVGYFAKYPGYPVNEEIIDELLNDLKSFIGEIPNITISEEK